MAIERISEAEYAVMEVLWEEAPATASQIAEQLEDSRDWSLQTVKTLLSRLAGKGAISHERDGRRFLYAPILRRSDYVGSESGRLVDRLFGGRAGPLFAHLAKREKLSDEDIAEIEALIREMKS